MVITVNSTHNLVMHHRQDIEKFPQPYRLKLTHGDGTPDELDLPSIVELEKKGKDGAVNDF